MEELARTRDRLLGVAGLLLACLAAGTAGYRLIEGWSLFDSLYMTVITVGTVGYGETHPLSTAGRAFTMVLILVGIGIFTYGFSTIAALVIEGDLSEAFRRRRMEKDIAKLTGHYVVCGAGHTGGVICAELRKTGRDFVIVDTAPATIEKLAERLGGEFPHVVGDGTEDDVLRRAGVERAAGVFAVLSSDQDNAFVVLSAKGLNPKARVLVCQKTLGVREKLLRSGADGVVDPEFIGGLRLASEMIRPVTVGFLDSMLREKGTHVRFDEVTVPADSGCVGRPIAEFKGAEGSGPLLVAVVPSGTDRYDINPPSARVISGGDRLVLIGETEAISALRKRIGDLS
ncbi:MAG: NAD-binding protein [Elusimicrobia bacterium]|nr:NAD-binding protein [Elusimicrobiota bacterium]